MSGNGAASKEVPGASDARVSLDQTFSHPAGLRTARHIVRALLERADGPSGNICRSPVEKSPQTSHALFGSNSAVMDDLKEILAFRGPPSSNAGRSEVETPGDGIALGDRNRSNSSYLNKSCKEFLLNLHVDVCCYSQASSTLIFNSKISYRPPHRPPPPDLSNIRDL